MRVSSTCAARACAEVGQRISGTCRRVADSKKRKFAMPFSAVRRLLGTVLLASFSVVAMPILAFQHPAQITVNGKSYRWPASPVVVILIDGGDPAYVHDGLARNLLPNFRRLITLGFGAIAQGAMPSFTNPNNISVITGVPPSVHGISGNFFLNPATGPGTRWLSRPRT
jgi:hypothetical protein